jgi:hypothetical protein
MSVARRRTGRLLAKVGGFFYMGMIAMGAQHVPAVTYYIQEINRDRALGNVLPEREAVVRRYAPALPSASELEAWFQLSPGRPRS